MKTSVLLLGAFGAMAVSAQNNYPSDMPACGVDCGNNVLGNAAYYGCGTNDFGCLCSNATFGYAIHDCSIQHCQNNTAADIAIAWGNALCASASITIGLPSATVPIVSSGSATGTVTATTVVSGSVTGPSGTGSVTLTGSVSSVVISGTSTLTTTGESTVTGETTLVSGSSGTVALTPSLTSTFTSVFTSDSSTFTTTGETTIVGASGTDVSSAGLVSAPSTTVEPIVSTVTSGSSTFPTTIGTTTSTAAALSRTSSAGVAPQQTVGPLAGLLMAAGVAAAVL